MGQGQMHEILAVEEDARGVFKLGLKKANDAFTGNLNAFTSVTKKYTPFDADRVEFESSVESMEMVTTVNVELRKLMQDSAEYFDVLAQRDATNQNAKADVVINGVTLLVDVPAVTLLALEKKVKQLRDVFNVIPTLPASKKWELDKSLGDGMYRLVDPDVTYKTQKSMEPVVLYEATKEHPAQVKEVSKVENVGKYVTTAQSGMMTIADKEALLERLNTLGRAVKQARQRANQEPVVSVNIGTVIADYLL